MKFIKVFILSIFLLLEISQVFAEERKDQLDKLFKKLKTNNHILTFEIEQKKCLKKIVWVIYPFSA